MTTALTYLAWLRAALVADATLYSYEVTDDYVGVFGSFLLPGVTESDVAYALRDHRRTSNARFTPAVVNDWVRRARIERHSRASYAPPESLGGDPSREIPWKRTYAQFVAEGTAPDEAYLAACHQHQCDPDDPFTSAEHRRRVEAVVKQITDRASKETAR
ncbi:hypothetical protein [Cellulomonas iranensis]|uniref:hypothetical protein n=1 Tax=Cellulomonas iranensis TaxID=76862 RepID=UPI003D7F1415